MTAQTLQNTLTSLLATDAPLDELLSMLRQFKTEGGSADAAHAVLAAVRSTVSGQREDRVLELMDFTAGFCSPHMKIWK